MKRFHRLLLVFFAIFALIGSGCSIQAGDVSVVSEESADIYNDTQDADEVLVEIEGAQKTQLTRGEFLALEQCTYNITRTNSKGKTTTGEYSGVKWGILAEAIGAPKDALSVMVIASDGFSQAYSMDILNAEKSVFAIYKDSAFITEEDENGQIWFCADENFTSKLLDQVYHEYRN